MDDYRMENLGRYARHPLRTAGVAFLAGVGASMMMSKMRKNDSLEE